MNVNREAIARFHGLEQVRGDGDAIDRRNARLYPTRYRPLDSRVLSLNGLLPGDIVYDVSQPIQEGTTTHNTIISAPQAAYVGSGIIVEPDDALVVYRDSRGLTRLAPWRHFHELIRRGVLYRANPEEFNQAGRTT